MTRNHSCSDTWVEAKIVPAIGEVCRRQALQWNSPRDLTAQYARPPQAGHSKPFGQRDAITTARHFSSVPYSASNPASLRAFWNCTLLRAIAVPRQYYMFMVCIMFWRLRKVRKQVEFFLG